MGDAVPKPRKARARTAKAAPSPVPAPEPSPASGLDEQIRRRLAEPSDDPTRTWAERIADALITAAAGGDLKSCDVLFRRAGGSAVEAVAAGPTIDDATARKVLEAARGSIKTRTHR